METYYPNVFLLSFNFRFKNGLFQTNLPLIMAILKEQRTSLSSMRQEVRAKDELLKTESQRIEKLVITMCVQNFESELKMLSGFESSFRNLLYIHTLLEFWNWKTF